MIHASTTTPRAIMDWKSYIKSKEDYDKVVGSGIAYLVFGSEFPNSWEECQEAFQHKQNLKLGEDDDNQC